MGLSSQILTALTRMTGRSAYAHSRNDDGNRHDLVSHLRAVAELAALDGAGAVPAGDIEGVVEPSCQIWCSQ